MCGRIFFVFHLIFSTWPDVLARDNVAHRSRSIVDDCLDQHLLISSWSSPSWPSCPCPAPSLPVLWPSWPSPSWPSCPCPALPDSWPSWPSWPSSPPKPVLLVLLVLQWVLLVLVVLLVVGNTPTVRCRTRRANARLVFRHRGTSCSSRTRSPAPDANNFCTSPTRP